MLFTGVWNLEFDLDMVTGLCTLIFRILALYFDFEGAKIIHVLQVLIWDFGGCWRYLTGVLHPDIDLDMGTGLWYNHIPKFDSLKFQGAKNIHVLKVLIWGFGGLWRFLTGVLQSDIDLDIVTVFFVHPYSEFLFSI